jgi:hypothetical protein
MLGSVETAHAGVRFRPYDQIERGQPQSRCGGVSDRQAAPIDERAENSSIYQVWKDGIHPLLVKLEELCIGHFSGRHHEFPMIAPGHVPPDRDIEGFIGEDHARDIYPHELFDEGRIGSVSADQAMGAEQEQIAYLSDCRGAGQRREIASFASILVFADYDLIDLVRTNPEISIGASAIMSSLNSASSSPMSQEPFSPKRLTANRSKRCSVSSR